MLAELEALPRDFVVRFRDIAGFRNILVHGYLEVDVVILHRVLNTRLHEFTEFAAHIEGEGVSGVVTDVPAGVSDPDGFPTDTALELATFLALAPNPHRGSPWPPPGPVRFASPRQSMPTVWYIRTVLAEDRLFSARGGS